MSMSESSKTNCISTNTNPASRQASHPRPKMKETINWSRPEIYFDVSEMPRLIEVWLAEKARTVETNTATGYREKISYFVEYIQRYDLGECSKTDIEDYALWLTQRPKQSDPSQPLGWNTRNDAHRRLRSFLRWAFREGYLSRNFADWVPPATGSRPIRAIPSLDAVSRMMSPDLTVPLPERCRAVVALLFGVGLRRVEIHRLNIPDIKVPLDGQAHLAIIGKAKKERLAAFDDVVSHHMNAYLEIRGYPTEGPLFVCRYGRRLSLQGVYNSYRYLAKAAGVFEQLGGTHDGRRMFITNWRRYQQGVHSDDLLRRQVGHSSVDMTSHYSLQDIDEVGRSFVSPLSAVGIPDQSKRPTE